MKNQTLILFLLLILSGCATQEQINTQSAIPKITDIDLQYASAEAKSKNKNLMIVYTQESCQRCGKWLSNIKALQKTDKLLDKFKLYHVNMQKGIEVVCPSGIELDDEEFYQAKGIEGELSIVFHNDIGEVVYTYNSFPDEKTLPALLKYINSKQYENRIDFEDWLNKS